MGRKIQVNENNVVVGGAEHDAGDELVISDAEFAGLPEAIIDATPLTPTKALSDLGASAHDEGDAVTTQVAAPAAVAALTSAVAVAAPTKAEYDALRADLIATRTTLAAVITALTGAGKPFSA